MGFHRNPMYVFIGLQTVLNTVKTSPGPFTFYRWQHKINDTPTHTFKWDSLNSEYLADFIAIDILTDMLVT